MFVVIFFFFPFHSPLNASFHMEKVESSMLFKKDRTRLCGGGQGWNGGHVGEYEDFSEKPPKDGG